MTKNEMMEVLALQQTTGKDIFFFRSFFKKRDVLFNKWGMKQLLKCLVLCYKNNSRTSFSSFYVFFVPGPSCLTPTRIFILALLHTLKNTPQDLWILCSPAWVNIPQPKERLLFYRLPSPPCSWTTIAIHSDACMSKSNYALLSFLWFYNHFLSQSTSLFLFPIPFSPWALSVHYYW
jgi:hypothetical protein